MEVKRSNSMDLPFTLLWSGDHQPGTHRSSPNTSITSWLWKLEPGRTWFARLISGIGTTMTASRMISLYGRTWTTWYARHGGMAYLLSWTYLRSSGFL